MQHGVESLEEVTVQDDDTYTMGDGIRTLRLVPGMRIAKHGGLRVLAPKDGEGDVLVAYEDGRGVMRVALDRGWPIDLTDPPTYREARFQLAERNRLDPQYRDGVTLSRFRGFKGEFVGWKIEVHTVDGESRSAARAIVTRPPLDTADPTAVLDYLLWMSETDNTNPTS